MSPPNKKDIVVRADKKMVDVLFERSIFSVLPSKEALKSKLLNGKRLKIYIGADPTGAELHIGHATNFILLEKLRKLGHEIIILFGDFTATVGDPTGKDSVRTELTAQDVEENIKTWKKQISSVLSFDDPKNPAKVLQNSKWLKKLNFEDVIKLASSFTVQHMIERDMFERRMKAGKPVYIHEFLYPLMQGYDSVAMNVDVEVGGSDQIFNMLVGRTLQKKYNHKEKFVIATTLLENPKTGKKLMSKSEGNFIGLLDSPHDMYGKTMALPDEAIVQVFTDCTDISLKEIKKIKKDLASGENPRDIKMKLARALVEMYHGKDKITDAEKQFTETFQKKKFPRSAHKIIVKKGDVLKNILVDGGIVTSNSEFRRLVKGGAIKNITKGEKIQDAVFEITEPVEIKIGKRKFVKIVFK